LIENVLVIGAGFLGSNIVKELEKREKKVTSTHYVEKNSSMLRLDISCKNDVESLCAKIEPDLVINSAAKNDIEFLEKNQGVAYEINTLGAENIAIAANKIGSKLFQISTDSVFDGKSGMYKEEDVPNPLNNYSNSKLLGEKGVIDNCKNHIIIRTNFYGHSNESKYLFDSILNKLINNEKFIGFNDVIFNPLQVGNLSELIIDLINSDFNGILHLSSNEIFSKYQFCLKIAEIFGFDTQLIQEGSIEQMNFLAKRPKNTSLDNSRSKSLIKTPITSLNDWLITMKKKYHYSKSSQIKNNCGN